MAIDFMTMPLSRYLSGHFVTPAMVVAWNAGLPYTVVGPNGRREVAENTPFGGATRRPTARGSCRCSSTI